MVLLAGAPMGERCPRHEEAGDEQERERAARLGGWRMVAWQLLKPPSRFDATLARVAPAQARVQVFDQHDFSYPASM
jgi:hypothetical protein